MSATLPFLHASGVLHGEQGGSTPRQQHLLLSLPLCSFCLGGANTQAVVPGLEMLRADGRWLVVSVAGVHAGWRLWRRRRRRRCRWSRQVRVRCLRILRVAGPPGGAWRSLGVHHPTRSSTDMPSYCPPCAAEADAEAKYLAGQVQTLAPKPLSAECVGPRQIPP